MAVMQEKLREFDRLAALLQMPRSERLGILNVPEETYLGLRAGNPASIAAIRPEFERRISYALPLMRRLATNSAVLALPVARQNAAA